MERTLQKMPLGVNTLYFIQAFSTFSFAIMYSSLALYLTQQLGLSPLLSNSIAALFIALNYILQLMSGLLGGCYLNNRSLFFITVFIQTLGLLLLSFGNLSTLYVALSLFLVGCGLNATAVNNMITQRFVAEDDRRETAFFLSYAATNLGYFAGYSASGFFDYSNQYHNLFLACILTNSVCLFLIIKSWAALADHNTPLRKITNKKLVLKKSIQGVLSIALIIPMLCLCFRSTNLSNGFIVLVCILLFIGLFALVKRQESAEDKQKLQTFLILALGSLLFWVLYLTAPLGITLFIKNNVNRHVYGVELATQWIRNINTLVIMFGAPLLAMLFKNLKNKGYHCSVSTQFIGAFIMLAGSFFFLAFGVNYADAQGYTPLFWVILFNICQGLAELLIGPAGFAMIGRLAPPQLQGLLMGSWMMISGVAASFSHYFSNAMVRSESTNPLITNTDFLYVFKELGIWSIAGALFLFLMSRKPYPKNLIIDKATP